MPEFSSIGFLPEAMGVLAQLQPPTTIAQSFYTPSADKRAVFTCLTVAVYTNDVILSVFHDDAGSTFDATTALIFSVKVEKEKNILILPLFGGLPNGGNMGVQIDNALNATFTLFGFETDDDC